jgi:hypothetical protein
MKLQSSRDERLNILVLRVSRALDGEKLDDVASVCALTSAYAIAASCPATAARTQAFQEITALCVYGRNSSAATRNCIATTVPNRV